MIELIKKKIFSKNLIYFQTNFLFVSFIFLSGARYDFFQLRFFVLILLIPCGLKIITDLFNKNFKSLIIFFLFFFILISHSYINIFHEKTIITKYNLFGIFLLSFIFVISFYFYEYFNINITKVIKLFLLLFFTSVSLSFLDFKNDAPFFCGGIPNIFEFLKFTEKYSPNGFDIERIGDLKLSFKEYLFPENSHLGMIAPSIIIYLIYINITKKTSKLLKFSTVIFIILCLIKSSTTLLLGTIFSLLLLVSLNFKYIPIKVLVSYISIIIIFALILITSKECRSRFVPIYSSTNNINQLNNGMKKIETVGEISPKFASKINSFFGVSGNLSSGVYFHSLMIAKKSILYKPFGWGINRYDKAFEYFNNKNPSKNALLNTLNNKDGTNNLVKLLVEIGVFSLVFYFFCLLFIIKKNIPLEYKLFYLPFIVTQSLRGAGYFNGGFSLIIFLMLFTYVSLNKNKL